MNSQYGKSLTRKLMAAGSVLLVAGLTGCQEAQVLTGPIAANSCGPANTAANPFAASPAGELEGDANAVALSEDVALLIKVKSALVHEPKLKTLPIDVGVLRGIITLYGRVDTPEHGTRAAYVAQKVAGVKEVKSALKISSVS